MEEKDPAQEQPKRRRLKKNADLQNERSQSTPKKQGNEFAVPEEKKQTRKRNYKEMADTPSKIVDESPLKETFNMKLRKRDTKSDDFPMAPELSTMTVENVQDRNFQAVLAAAIDKNQSTQQVSEIVRNKLGTQLVEYVSKNKHFSGRVENYWKKITDLTKDALAMGSLYDPQGQDKTNAMMMDLFTIENQVNKAVTQDGEVDAYNLQQMSNAFIDIHKFANTLSAQFKGNNFVDTQVQGINKLLGKLKDSLTARNARFDQFGALIRQTINESGEVADDSDMREIEELKNTELVVGSVIRDLGQMVTFNEPKQTMPGMIVQETPKSLVQHAANQLYKEDQNKNISMTTMATAPTIRLKGKNTVLQVQKAAEIDTKKSREVGFEEEKKNADIVQINTKSEALFDVAYLKEALQNKEIRDEIQFLIDNGEIAGDSIEQLDLLNPDVNQYVGGVAVQLQNKFIGGIRSREEKTLALQKEYDDLKLKFAGKASLNAREQSQLDAAERAVKNQLAESNAKSQVEMLGRAVQVFGSQNYKKDQYKVKYTYNNKFSNEKIEDGPSELIERAQTYMDDCRIRSGPFVRQQNELLTDLRHGHRTFYNRKIVSQESQPVIEDLNDRNYYAYLASKLTDDDMIDSSHNQHPSRLMQFPSAYGVGNRVDQDAYNYVKRQDKYYQRYVNNANQEEYEQFAINVLEPSFNQQTINNVNSAQKMLFPATYSDRNFQFTNSTIDEVENSFVNYPIEKKNREYPEQYRFYSTLTQPSRAEAWTLLYGPLSQFMFRVIDQPNIFTQTKQVAPMLTKELAELNDIERSIKQTFLSNPYQDNDIFTEQEINDTSRKLQFLNMYNLHNLGQPLSVRDVQAALQTQMLNKFVNIFHNSNEPKLLNKRRKFYLGQLMKGPELQNKYLAKDNFLASPLGQNMITGMFKKMNDIAINNLGSLGVPDDFPQEVFDDAFRLRNIYSDRVKSSGEQTERKRIPHQIFSGRSVKGDKKTPPWQLQSTRWTAGSEEGEKYNHRFDSRKAALLAQQERDEEYGDEEMEDLTQKKGSSRVKDKDALEIERNTKVDGEDMIHYEMYTEDRYGFPSLRRRAFDPNFYSTNYKPINFNVDSLFGVSMIVPHLMKVADQFIQMGYYDWDPQGKHNKPLNIDSVFLQGFHPEAASNPLTTMYNIYQAQLEPFKSYQKLRAQVDKKALTTPKADPQVYQFDADYHQTKTVDRDNKPLAEYKTFDQAVNENAKYIMDYFHKRSMAKGLTAEQRRPLTYTRGMTDKEIKDLTEAEKANEELMTKQAATERFFFEQDYCTVCFGGEAVDAERGQSKFSQCCGRRVHKNCFASYILKQSGPYSEPLRSYSCNVCGFTPTGLVDNRAYSIYYQNKQKGKPYDEIEESRNWIKKLDSLKSTFEEKAVELAKPGEQPVQFKYQPGIYQTYVLGQNRDLAKTKIDLSKDGLYFRQIGKTYLLDGTQESARLVKMYADANNGIPKMVLELDNIFGYDPRYNASMKFLTHFYHDSEQSRKDKNRLSVGPVDHYIHMEDFDIFDSENKTNRRRGLEQREQKVQDAFLKPAKLAPTAMNLLEQLLGMPLVIMDLQSAVKNYNDKIKLERGVSAQLALREDGKVYSPYQQLSTEEQNRVQKQQAENNSRLEQLTSQNVQAQKKIVPVQIIQAAIEEKPPEQQQQQQVIQPQQPVQQVPLPQAAVGQQQQQQQPEIIKKPEDEEMKEEVKQEQVVEQQQQQQQQQQQIIPAQPVVQAQRPQQDQDKEMKDEIDLIFARTLTGVNNLVKNVDMINQENIEKGANQQLLKPLELQSSQLLVDVRPPLVPDGDQRNMLQGKDQVMVDESQLKQKAAAIQELMIKNAKQDELQKMNALVQQFRSKFTQLQQSQISKNQEEEKKGEGFRPFRPVPRQPQIQLPKISFNDQANELRKISESHQMIARQIFDRVVQQDNQINEMRVGVKNLFETVLTNNNKELIERINDSRSTLNRIVDDTQLMKFEMTQARQHQYAQFDKYFSANQQVLESQGKLLNVVQQVKDLTEKEVPFLTDQTEKMKQHYEVVKAEIDTFESYIGQYNKIGEELQKLEFGELNTQRDKLIKDYSEAQEKLAVLRQHFTEQKSAVENLQVKRTQIESDYTKFYGDIQQNMHNAADLQELYQKLPPSLDDYLNLSERGKSQLLFDVAETINKKIKVRSDQDKQLMEIQKKVLEFTNATSIYANTSFMKKTIKDYLSQTLSQTDRTTYKLEDSDIERLGDPNSFQSVLFNVDNLIKKKKTEEVTIDAQVKEMKRIFNGVRDLPSIDRYMDDAVGMTKKAIEIQQFFGVNIKDPQYQLVGDMNKLTFEQMNTNIRNFENSLPLIESRKKIFKDMLVKVDDYNKSLHKTTLDMKTQDNQIFQAATNFNNQIEFLNTNPSFKEANLAKINLKDFRSESDLLNFFKPYEEWMNRQGISQQDLANNVKSVLTFKDKIFKHAQEATAKAEQFDLQFKQNLESITSTLETTPQLAHLGAILRTADVNPQNYQQVLNELEGKTQGIISQMDQSQMPGNIKQGERIIKDIKDASESMNTKVANFKYQIQLANQHIDGLYKTYPNLPQGLFLSEDFRAYGDSNYLYDLDQKIKNTFDMPMQEMALRERTVKTIGDSLVEITNKAHDSEMKYSQTRQAVKQTIETYYQDLYAIGTNSQEAIDVVMSNNIEEMKKYMKQLDLQYLSQKNNYAAKEQFVKELDQIIKKTHSSEQGWVQVRTQMQQLKEKLMPFAEELYRSGDPQYAHLKQEEINRVDRQVGFVDAYRPVATAVKKYHEDQQKKLFDIQTQLQNVNLNIQDTNARTHEIQQKNTQLDAALKIQIEAGQRLAAIESANSFYTNNHAAYQIVVQNDRSILNRFTQQQQNDIQAQLNEIQTGIQSFSDLNNRFNANKNKYVAFVQNQLEENLPKLPDIVKDGLHTLLELKTLHSQPQMQPLQEILDKMIQWNQNTYKSLLKRYAFMTHFAITPPLEAPNYQSEMTRLTTASQKYVKDIADINASIINQKDYINQIKQIATTIAINTHHMNDSELKRSTLEAFSAQTHVKQLYDACLFQIAEKNQHINDLADNLNAASFTFDNQTSNVFRNNLKEINNSLRSISSNQHLQQLQHDLSRKSEVFFDGLMQDMQDARNNPRNMKKTFQEHLRSSGIGDLTMQMQNLYFKNFKQIFESSKRAGFNEAVDEATQSFVSSFTNAGFGHLVDQSSIKQNLLTFFQSINHDFKDQLLDKVSQLISINLKPLTEIYDEQQIVKMFNMELPTDKLREMMNDVGDNNANVERAHNIEQQIGIIAQNDENQHQRRAQFNRQSQVEEEEKKSTPPNNQMIQPKNNIQQQQQQQRPQMMINTSSRAQSAYFPGVPVQNELSKKIAGNRFGFPTEKDQIKEQFDQQNRGFEYFKGISKLQDLRTGAKSIYDFPTRGTSLTVLVEETRNLSNEQIPSLKTNIAALKNSLEDDKGKLELNQETLDKIVDNNSLENNIDQIELRQRAKKTLKEMVGNVMVRMIEYNFLANANDIDDLSLMEKIKAYGNIFKHAPQICAAMLGTAVSRVEGLQPISPAQIDKIQNVKLALYLAQREFMKCATAPSNQSNDNRLVQQAQDLFFNYGASFDATLKFIDNLLVRANQQQDLILEGNIQIIDEVLRDIIHEEDTIATGRRVNKRVKQFEDEFVGHVEKSLVKSGLKEMIADDNVDGRQLRQYAKQASQAIAPRIYQMRGGQNVGGFGGGYNRMGEGVSAPGANPDTRYMMAYPGSQAVQQGVQGGQQNGGGGGEDGKSSSSQRLTGSAMGVLEELKISREDMEFLKKVRYDPSLQRVRIKNDEQGEERDLSREEKIRFVKIMIKIIVLMYALSVEDVSAAEKKRVEQKLQSKYMKEGVDGKMGKLFATVNKLAENIHGGINKDQQQQQ